MYFEAFFEKKQIKLPKDGLAILSSFLVATNDNSENFLLRNFQVS